MANYAVRKASDLAPEQRALIERWLGRPLAVDETISLSAYRAHPAPTATERQGLRRDIITEAREIGARAGDISEQEAGALVDEALRQIRSSSE